MKLNLKLPTTLCLLSFVFLFFSSCSKDSDLLSDYVVNNSDPINSVGKRVLDDTFILRNNNAIVLDVLQNDLFENINNVKIIETSLPKSGSITINDDNTLTYSLKKESNDSENIVIDNVDTVDEEPEENTNTQSEVTDEVQSTENENTETPVVDTFTYTTEELNEDGTSNIEEGEITVQVVNSSTLENSFWTKTQMDIVKLRLMTGWDNKSFPNEVELIINSKNHFLNNPQSTRYLNIDKSTSIGAFSIEYDASTSISLEPLVNNNPYIDYPFKAAVWGRAFEDTVIANTLLEELLFYTSHPDYDFSNTTKFPRDRRSDINPYFLMMAWMGKWHEVYREYISDYSNINDSQRDEIEFWFDSAADWGYHTGNVLISKYLGQDWIYSDLNRSSGLSNSSSPIIEDENGNPYLQYKISDFSSALNNRLWDGIEFVHSYGLHSGKELYRDMGVSFFKYTLKYHVYPNGLIGEMKRITSSDTSLGLAYCHVILTGMVRVAHAEETAMKSGLIAKHGWSPEFLYDYETNEGHVSGQIYDGYIYNGGSTTNGNMKSLKLALTATSKFYRSAEHGGFNPKFYFAGKAITGENRKYPALFGMANSYYNDQFLYEHSVMDTNAGLPSGSINSQGGFGIGVMSWGKGISPILWIGMENQIFN